MPSKRHTYPTDPSLTVFDDCGQIPTNAFAALMETAPFEDPEESWDEKQERLDPLRDALELVLDPREMWVIEGLYWRRVGLRSIGQELSLSKTHVARIRDEALTKLYQHFEGEYQ